MQYLIAVAACCILLCSCSTTKRVTTQSAKPKLLTHRQVLNSFKTKNDLIERFGQPAEVQADDVFEYWYYYFGSSYKGITLNGTNMSLTRINEDKAYLKFTIDADGNVYKWKSHGVNMREQRAK